MGIEPLTFAVRLLDYGEIIITIILDNIEITIIFEFEIMMYLFSMSLQKKIVTENFEISP